MFNLLFNPKKAERHPIEMLLIGFFYSSVSILLSMWIFPEYSSLLMVFLTLLSCLYVVQGSIKLEESKEQSYNSEGFLLEEHFKVLYFFLFLFLGFVISFAFWTTVLSVEKVSVLFDFQSSVVQGVRSLTGTGNAIVNKSFFIILFNNFKVLLISLILAFFYGAGAIFVMVWNASVMGFVIGNLAKNAFGLLSLPVAFTKYFLHGIPEMLAYLTISLAGGIIYVSVARGDFFETGKAKKILLDVFVLFLISVLLLVIAALIEVYISPYF